MYRVPFVLKHQFGILRVCPGNYICQGTCTRRTNGIYAKAHKFRQPYSDIPYSYIIVLVYVECLAPDYHVYKCYCCTFIFLLIIPVTTVIPLLHGCFLSNSSVCDTDLVCTRPLTQPNKALQPIMNSSCHMHACSSREFKFHL